MKKMGTQGIAKTTTAVMAMSLVMSSAVTPILAGDITDNSNVVSQESIVQVLAEQGEVSLSDLNLAEGTYYVPIKSLVSAAPIPAVKNAVASSLGDTATLVVGKDGNKIYVTPQHVQINLGMVYHANILTLKSSISGEVVGEGKEELSSVGMGSPETTTITVPAQFVYETTGSATETLTITVDFMGSMETNVDITLDYSNIKADTSSLSKLVEEYSQLDLTNYTDVTASALTTALENAKAFIPNNATPDELQQAVSSLESAFNGLVKKSEDIKDEDNKVDDSNKEDNKDDNKENDKEEIKDDTTGSDNVSDDNQATTDVIDKDNLKDGQYTVDIYLWNANEDKASMASSAFLKSATIIVENGVKKMVVQTQPMKFGAITASMQEMKIANENGEYVDATVVTTSEDGNPTSFEFELPSTEEYISIKVNPHVAMMGNMDLDARLKVDYATLAEKSASDIGSDNEDKNDTVTDDKTSNDTVIEDTSKDNTSDSNNGATIDNSTSAKEDVSSNGTNENKTSQATTETVSQTGVKTGDTQKGLLYMLTAGLSFGVAVLAKKGKKLFRM